MLHYQKGIHAFVGMIQNGEKAQHVCKGVFSVDPSA